MKGNTTLKELDLSSGNGSNIGGPVGAKHVADMLRGHGALTSVSLPGNKFDVETASMLLKVKEEKPNLRTLCGLTHEETELNYVGQGLGPGDAILLAAEMPNMGSLMSINLSNNIPYGSDQGPAFAQALVEVVHLALQRAHLELVRSDGAEVLGGLVALQ